MIMTDTSFATMTIGEIDALTEAEGDAMPFGIVGMDAGTVVEVYNATEAQLSGLDASRVIGTRFFDVIGQCMNNFMVAQRFEDEPELDDIIHYVLTLRMRPTKVRLRLLATPDVARRYLLIER